MMEKRLDNLEKTVPATTDKLQEGNNNLYYADDKVETYLYANDFYYRMWLNNTFSSISSKKDYTCAVQRMYSVGDGSVGDFNITLDTATGDSGVRQLFYFFMPAYQTGYNTLNFTNSVLVDTKTKLVLYPGDYVIISREGVVRSKTGALVTEGKSCTIVMAGNVSQRRGNLIATDSIKTGVLTGTFKNGELQGTQPAGSIAGMRFTDTTYRYEYMTSAADTDGSAFVWVRTTKA